MQTTVALIVLLTAAAACGGDATTERAAGTRTAPEPKGAPESKSAPESNSAPGPAPTAPTTVSGLPVIPLCAGLTVVTAIASHGDYESIKTIESVGSDSVRLKYSSESSPPWWSPFRGQLNRLITYRTVLKSDLESAHGYHQIFVGTKSSPESAPGYTAIGTSTAVLNRLKSAGESELSLCASAEDAPVMRGDRLHQVPGGCHNFTDPIPLQRVGGPVALRVLVDGAPVDLPAIQARGKSASGGGVEFFFLDDERNPLTLAFRLGIGEMAPLDPETRRLCENEGKKTGIILTGGLSCDLPDGGDRDTLRVIKISTRCDLPPAATASAPGGTGPAPGAGDATLSGAGAAALEKALADTGTVDVYSIYFSFNSDVLREESEPTLKDIAEVLRRHPDWKLRVSGHTDGIGTDQFNLDLSRRRAGAVKMALLERFGIAPDRLDTAGFGESQPRDTNETLEGRARNRRVELIRSGA